MSKVLLIQTARYHQQQLLQAKQDGKIDLANSHRMLRDMAIKGARSL